MLPPQWLPDAPGRRRFAIRNSQLAIARAGGRVGGYNYPVTFDTRLPGTTAAVIMTLMLLAQGCGKEPSTREVEIPATFHLIENLDGAEHESAAGTWPEIQWRELGIDRRISVETTVPYRLRYRGVRCNREALFRSGIAALSTESGDPDQEVTFIVECRGANGAPLELVNQRLTPEPDPQWTLAQVSLAHCSSPFTVIELRTSCAAEPCPDVVAAWGAPKTDIRRSIATQLDQLVLLISIDTLRPDRMGLYGGPAATPALEALAGDGVIFDTVVAPSPWTIPSHASLFTSTYPNVHGTTAAHEMPSSLPTLAETLQAAGWDTAGFVDTPWLGRFGFPRGHRHYHRTTPPLPRWGVDVTSSRLLRWLGEVDEERLYLFWHIMDVHGPYGATAPFAGRRRKMIDPGQSRYPEVGSLSSIGYHGYLELERFLSVEEAIGAYDESISMVDAGIGTVLEVLRDAGLYDDALIVVTSDHGESFLDHKVWIGHGLFLTDDEIRIPLVIKLPKNRGAGTRVAELTRLVDVAPTILDTVGVDLPTSFAGASLLPIMGGAGDPEPRVAYGSSSNTGGHYVRTLERKYITAWGRPQEVVEERHLHPTGDPPFLHFIDSGERFFDLDLDPDELINLKDAADRQYELDDFRRRATDASLVPVDTPSDDTPLALDLEEIERLRALGYLQE